MKITNSNPKEKYAKHSVTFTMETAEEAQSLYCIFNHADVCDFLEAHSDISGQDIRESICVNGDVNYHEIWLELTRMFSKRKGS